MFFKIKFGHHLRKSLLGPLTILALFMGAAHAQAAADVQKPEFIQDSFVGEAAAPVTLIVYSSPTCGHCIDFHEDKFKQLQNTYVRRGALKISMRPFVRNSPDAVIFLIAKESGEDRFDQTVSGFMGRMDEITGAGEGAEAAVRKIASDMGIDQQTFDRALSNQAYLDQLKRSTAEANEAFGVKGTPSFFVNAKQIVLKQSFAEIDDAIDAAARR